MGEVADFEDILAVLDDESSRVHHSTQPSIHPHHLSQLHTTSSLPNIPDGLSFSLSEQTGLEIGPNGELLTNQTIPIVPEGMGHISNTLLDSASVQDSFSTHVEQPSQSAMHTGSSLGSLFLDSVDEMLSNEKQTDFAPPQMQSVSHKPPQFKPKKPAQHKAEKIVQPTSTFDPASTVLVQQQLVDPGAGVVLKPDDQIMYASAAGNPFKAVKPNQGIPPLPQSSASSGFFGTQSPESYPRPGFRQQAVQLSRPHSNASSEAIIRPGSVPQPSPAGSVDSNFAPRTPLSNNPLTPQSLHQPATPQSNNSLHQQSIRSRTTTPLMQMQQHTNLLQENSFLAMEQPHSSIMTDDQSHLQYLNTSSSFRTTSSKAPSAAFAPIAAGLQTSANTPFNTFHDSYSSMNPQGTTASWLQSGLRKDSVVSMPQQHGVRSLDSFSSSTLSGQTFASDLYQNFPSGFPKSGDQLCVSSYLNPISRMTTTALSSYETTAGLTHTQSQLLDKVSEWSKAKPKTVIDQWPRQGVVSARPDTILPLRSDQPAYGSDSVKSLPFASATGNKQIIIGDENPKSGTMLTMLSTAETGVKKQIFSYSSNYEDVSPTSDSSPAHKDLPENKLPENLSQEPPAMLSQRQTSSPFGVTQVGITTNQEKTRVGFRDRRRSAQNELKANHGGAKVVESDEFDFDDDEFDFGHNEPTIRLPTKRAGFNEVSGSLVRSTPSEPPKPILAQTIHRDNYSDPSVFDSVQEVAALRKSLMEVSKSRNMPQSQKPSRHVQKSVTPNQISNNSSSVNKRNAANYVTKSVKAKKSATSRVEVPRESTLQLVSTKPSGTRLPDSQISPNETSTDNDLFVQQFLANTSQAVSKSSSACDLHLKTSYVPSSHIGSVHDSSKPSCLAASQTPRSNNTMTSILTSESYSSRLGFSGNTLTNADANFNINNSQVVSAASSAMPISASDISVFLASSQGSSTPPKTMQTSYATALNSSLGQRNNLFDDFSSMSTSCTVAKSVPFVQAVSPNTERLLEIYTQRALRDDDPPSNYPIDTQNPYGSSKERFSSDMLFAASSSSFSKPASGRAHVSSHPPANGTQSLLHSATYTQADIFTSMLSKQSSGAGSMFSTNSPVKKSMSNSGNQNVPRISSSVKTTKTSAERAPILPDMSQIQVDYALPSTTNLVTGFSSVGESMVTLPSGNVFASVRPKTTLPSAPKSHLSVYPHHVTIASTPHSSMDASVPQNTYKSTSDKHPSHAHDYGSSMTKVMEISQLSAYYPTSCNALTSTLSNELPLTSLTALSAGVSTKPVSLQPSSEVSHLSQQSREDLKSTNSALSMNSTAPTVASRSTIAISSITSTLPSYQQVESLRHTRAFSSSVSSSVSSDTLRQAKLQGLPFSYSSSGVSNTSLNQSLSVVQITGRGISASAKSSLDTSTAVSFSSKSLSSVLAFDSAVSSTPTSSCNSFSQADTHLKTTVINPTTSTGNILKDKTYYGFKKKHILEKYCQQQNPSSIATQQAIKPTLTSHKTNELTSGPSTSRRLSADKQSAQNKGKLLSHGKTKPVGNNTLVAPVTRSTAAEKNRMQNQRSAQCATSSTVTSSVSTVTSSAPSKTSHSSEGNSSKNEPSGSIFSLFDTLIQEASQTAANSLKKVPNKKKGNSDISIPTIKPAAVKAPTSKPHSAKLTSTKTPMSKTNASRVLQKEALRKSKETPGKHEQTTLAKEVVDEVASTTTVAKPSDTLPASSSAGNDKNSTVTNRSPATLPFKRRHQHLNKDTSVSSITVTGSDSLETSGNFNQTTVISQPSTTSSSGTPSVETSTIIMPSVTVAGDNVGTAIQTSSDAAQKVTGLKLRITAFRSFNGQVIHQSTLMGDLSNASDSEDDDYRSWKKKKKKHKKQKKSRQKFSSGSSVASPNVSLNSPKPDVLMKITSNNNEYQPIATKASLNSLVTLHDSENDNLTLPDTKKRKRKELKLILQPPAKRLASAETGNSDQERSKKQTKSTPKKQTPKVVSRYKLKSSQSLISQGNDGGNICLPLNRVPGKRPLYLTAGANQTLVSGSNQSVPTIQLVPRSSVKSVSKITASLPPVSPLQSAAKLLSVKLSSTSAKTTQTHIVPKATPSGIRYILQTSSISSNSLSPRIIIPKLTPSFSVGKATVFTVSSTGARVSGAPTIQIQPTPTQITSSKQITGIIPPKQPVILKHVPVSILSKAALSSASPQKCKAPTFTPAVVTFTSKPAEISGKILSPKPVFSSSEAASSALPRKSVSCSNALTTPTITDALQSNVPSIQSCCFTPYDFPSALSKLISSPNPLPKYVPPDIPEHFILTDDEIQTKQCSECGDAFLFHNTLQHHYDRRSIWMKVRCVQCSQMLVFFNKCEILRHAREHSDHGEVMQFNGAQVTPIPLSLCKRRPKDYFLQAAKDRNKLSKSSAERKTARCAMACTECSYITDGDCTLEDHFQRRSTDLRTCDICKLPLHNQCAHSSHMRMHRHVAPYTCPECGQTFDEKRMDFNLHLRIQCFHASRVSCFKCKLCNLTFLTDDQLRHHFRLNHVHVYYKCRECPVAFKTTENIATHQRSAHNLTPEPINTLKTIYQCPLCDTVIKDSSHSQQLCVLHKHFDGHISSARITAYKCYLCTNLFEQKASLREHLQKEHAVSSINEAARSVAVSSSCSGQPKQIQPLVVSKADKEQSIESDKTETMARKPSTAQTSKSVKGSTVKSSGKQLTRKRSHPDCKTNIETSSYSIAKKSRQTFKIRLKKGAAKSTFTSTHSSDDSSGGTSPVQSPRREADIAKEAQEEKKTYPCPECDKIFFSTHSRSSHIRGIHRGIRSLYCCSHCPLGTVKFAKRCTLVKHLKRVHGLVSVGQEDITIIRAHIPISKPGEKFKAADVKLDKNGVVTTEKTSQEKKMPRKKITTRNPAQARSWRLAATKRRMRLKGGFRASDDSEESYGEVDEKTVEDGWNEAEEEEEETNQKQENEDVGEVDASLFHFPDIYTCIKCDFQHSNRIVFQDHIGEHLQPSDGNDSASTAVLTMVQCTECGLSFASTASLDKHLHIKHKIKRRALLERYDAKLRAERANSTDAASNPSSSASTSNIYRCKVCFRKFEQEANLKTHMRTHGLAFVKSKQH